jgi:tetratricopeptide (TPR) repeat protein
MAMKYVKPFTALFILLLAGCASKPAQLVVADKVPLRDTQQYIPQQAYDDKGMKIPYVAQPNPYLELTGQVAKGSVLLFIEAKKLIAAKNFAVAEQKLKVIAEKDKTLAGPLVLLGDLAMQNNDYSTAENYYQQALDINEKNVNAYLGLAESQRKRGRFSFAQNTYEHALNVWSDFPEAHLNLGILYDLYLNLPAKAQAHYEAYLFLTNYKQSQVSDWFDEVKGRTGLTTSFVDNGPPLAEKNRKIAAGQ